MPLALWEVLSSEFPHSHSLLGKRDIKSGFDRVKEEILIFFGASGSYRYRGSSIPED